MAAGVCSLSCRNHTLSTAVLMFWHCIFHTPSSHPNNLRVAEASDTQLTAELEQERRTYALAEQNVATLEEALQVSKVQATHAVQAAADSAQAHAVEAQQARCAPFYDYNCGCLLLASKYL